MKKVILHPILKLTSQFTSEHQKAFRILSAQAHIWDVQQSYFRQQ